VAVTLNQAVRNLLDAANPAVLATLNSDGSPQTSVVWVGRDGDDVLISSASGRRKDRNVRQDPRVSLSVYDQDDPEQYAEIRGLAAVTADVGRAFAVELGEKYNGPGGGREFLERPPEEVRIVIRISPQHVAGSVAG
jgi:PPOX class probable F420-dependent enzyme